MTNKNQSFTSKKTFKFIFIARRISYWGIILSLALIIISIISILIIVFYTPQVIRIAIYRPIHFTREDLIQTVISSITIPSIFSTGNFTFINLILKKILKKYYPTSNEKVIINILESLKLHNIQEPDPSNLF